MKHPLLIMTPEGMRKARMRRRRNKKQN